ncbi:MAG TPA: hypothetical protein VJ901_06040 [Thermoanaerobaculia bacterium]|nr:hypothetical protein [Thermoanaerobaculia bacterium]
MVQHIFVVPGPNGPVAQPFQINIFRDDQSLSWNIMVPNLGWDNSDTPLPDGPGGPNIAVQIQPSSPPWLGSVPVPVGPPPSLGLDKRPYIASGPGPNTGANQQLYTYFMYVVDDRGNHFRIQALDDRQEVIDPDIGNQPQP